MNSGLQVYNYKSVQYKMSHDESNDVPFVWCAIEYTSARATYFISFPNDHPVGVYSNNIHFFCATLLYHMYTIVFPNILTVFPSHVPERKFLCSVSTSM